MREETISLGIRCPRSLNDKLEEISKAAGKNKTQLILDYIKAGVENENPVTLAGEMEILKKDNAEFREQLVELRQLIESGKLAA